MTGTRRGAQRRGWGKIRRLPSGRYQASYVGPDLARHTAPDTFDAKLDAEAWLAVERQRIAAGTWASPGTVVEPPPVLTFGEYAETWLEHRELRDTTRRQYRHSLDRFLLPAFGIKPIEEITPTLVSRWNASQRRLTGPTQAAHNYALLRTIFNAAVREDVVPSNPCRVPGAGQARAASKMTTLEPAEIAALAEAMPERLRLLVLLGAWGGLRLGELLELRRGDVDLDAGTVTVRRQVQHIPGRPPSVGEPKTAAGARTVHLPARVVEALRRHLDAHAAAGHAGLLFPGPNGGHLAPSTVRGIFKRAAEAAGLPDLRIHGLRHTGLTLAARTGATVAELMARAGHASPQAALRYQHAAQSRDAAIAAAFDEM
jgi:integrase